MEFGLFSESGTRRSSLAADAFQADLEEILLADELGFSEVWIAETNQVRSNSVTHAHLLMCLAAGQTRRIRFGSGIRQLPLHHPVDVVQEANMCDQLTRGRYMFGYGGTHLVSSEQLLMRGLDVGPADTRAMVHESIQIIERCWTATEPFDFQGRYWQGRNVHVLPRPYQQPHPPIAAACSGSADTIELAAHHGYLPLFGRGSDAPEEVRGWGDLYVCAATAAGQVPTRRSFRVTHTIFVGETDAQARAAAREGLTYKLATVDPSHLGKRIPPGGSIADLTFDYLADQGFYWIGTPETVYRLIRDYYEESGGFGTLLVHAGSPVAEPEQVARSLRLFAQEVMPRLAALDPATAADAAGAPLPEHAAPGRS